MKFYILLLAFLFFYNSCSVKKENGVCKLEIGDTALICTGDIIFRKGHDFLSNLVLAQKDSAFFSHVGLIIKVDSRLLVVHAMPHEPNQKGGVLVEPLDNFISCENASASSIYRVKDLCREDIDIVKDYLLLQIGKPFDSNFQFSNNDRYYCTELVIKALEQVYADISTTVLSTEVFMMDEKVFLPDDLRKSFLLEKVFDVNSDLR
ncbi:MAG: YiiX/YebB-like N1pC/P60 family cysteine hydrolase [Cyclobacteriaceae bacterium]|nr:YiiX/YebB-like N1pC/P60 family cysteine hydrolase [Cyclobacteriaceae bacterium]MDW8330797.1 YiiX/YebB-like N1pC/P60 family cysteine hydrolase [Cyclobacteriaceae bacterium]